MKKPVIFDVDQETIIQKAIHHVVCGPEQVYQFRGKAGTGKTEVIKEIIRRLIAVGIPFERIAIMTYIGQAAIVLRVRGIYSAKTIHSTLYEFVEQTIVDKYGNPIMDNTFNKPKIELVFKPKELHDVDLFIIDEARTVPLSMKHEIESRGKKIIACGDHRQLPPVNDEPAYLRDEDLPYIDNINVVKRQGKGSDILAIADMLYEGKELSAGCYGSILVVEEKDLTDEMIKASQIVICGKNKTRDSIIDRVRTDILNVHTKLPMYGEKLICRKNDWLTEVDGISLANGVIGQVIKPPDIQTFDGKSFTIDFKPDLINSYFPNVICDYKYFTAKHEDREFIKNDKYSIGHKFEYAYAITAHLSQGAQYPNGIYIKEYMPGNIQKNIDYTGVTRFSQMEIIVIPNRKRFF